MGAHANSADFEEFESEDPLFEVDRGDADAAFEKAGAQGQQSRRRWRSVEQYKEWKRLRNQLDDYDIDEDIFR